MYRVHYFHHTRDDAGKVTHTTLRFVLSNKEGIEALRSEGHTICCID